MCFPPTVWFKPPWELLYKRSRTPETLKAVQVALVKPVAYLLSYRQVKSVTCQEILDEFAEKLLLKFKFSDEMAQAAVD